jgi:hypothetical protein
MGRIKNTCNLAHAHTVAENRGAVARPFGEVSLSTRVQGRKSEVIWGVGVALSVGKKAAVIVAPLGAVYL